MIDTLIDLDKSLLQTLNNCHTPFWDNFFWMVTAIPTWIPFYLVILYVIVRNQPKGWWFTFIALGLMVTLSDQISNNLFKDMFERLRPSRDPSMAGLVQLVAGYTGGKYGFVSSHAANSFALAMFGSLLFRHRLFAWSIFAWATLNSYSRIYLGVHFPGDIICGALLGLLIGWLVYVGYRYVYPRFANGKNPTRQPGLLGEKIFPCKHMKLLAFSLAFGISVLLIVAKVMLKMQG
ncbi:MAG: phosphatase PAP2 family protein [Breznakibacter sp.]